MRQTVISHLYCRIVVTTLTLVDLTANFARTTLLGHIVWKVLFGEKQNMFCPIGYNVYGTKHVWVFQGHVVWTIPTKLDWWG